MKDPNQKISQLPGGGWISDPNQPFGCQLCQKGMKVVYFMGGGCVNPSHCSWYCPISDERKSEFTHFIDEIPINNPQSIEETIKIIQTEVEKVNANGMSLTGGDPLSTSRKKDWACGIIFGVKELMGSDFHIHLYTSGDTFDSLIADRLDQVGLDDLRFHPSIKNFGKIELALDHSYSVAAEVPVIPTEENHVYLLRLADHLNSIGANFLNLNEFEMCEPNQKSLIERGFTLEPNAMATVKGSREYDQKFIDEFGIGHQLKVHYCTTKMKDQIQLRQRFLRRAQHIHFPFEEVTQDGTLLFFRIKGALQTITLIYDDLLNISNIPKEMMHLEKERG